MKAIVTFGQTAPKLESVAKEAGLQIVNVSIMLDQAVSEAYAYSR